MGHKVAEFGIACEACHSEGREHIAANRNPFRRWKLHLTKSADADDRERVADEGTSGGFDVRTVSQRLGF